MVLNLDVTDTDAVRARRSQCVPTVMTKQEVPAVIQQYDGIDQLVVKLLYGSSFRDRRAAPARQRCVDFA
jgi:hypothetical protein